MADAPPPGPPKIGGPSAVGYVQIAQIAAGNGLALLFIYIFYILYKLCATFQEPLLWAWLCSIALKDVHGWLVVWLQDELSSRPLPLMLLRLVFFPLLVVMDCIHEASAYVKQQQQQQQDSQQHLEGGRSSGAYTNSTSHASTGALPQLSRKAERNGHTEKHGSSKEGGETCTAERHLRDAADSASNLPAAGPTPAHAVQPGSAAGRKKGVYKAGKGKVKADGAGGVQHGGKLQQSRTELPHMLPKGRGQAVQDSHAHQGPKGQRPAASLGDLSKLKHSTFKAYSLMAAFVTVSSRTLSRQLRQSPVAGGNSSDGKTEGLGSTAGDGEAEGEMPSTHIFIWLFRAAVLYQLGAFAVSWGMRVMVCVVLGLVAAFALFVLTARRVSRAVLRAVRGAQAAAEAHLASLCETGDEHAAESGPGQRLGQGSGKGHQAAARGPTRAGRMHGSLRAAASAAVYGRKALVFAVRMALSALQLALRMAQGFDAWVRAALTENLDQLVAAGLVAALVLGSLGLSAVLVVQVGSEGRQAVVGIDRMLRSSMANGTHLDDAAASLDSLRAKAAGGRLGSLLASQRTTMLSALATAQQHMLTVLPSALSYVDDVALTLVERFNLTPVVRDLEKVYYSLPVALNCSSEQKEVAAAEVALAALRLSAASQLTQELSQQVAGNSSALAVVLHQWEASWLAQKQAQHGQPATHTANQPQTTSSGPADRRYTQPYDSHTETEGTSSGGVESGGSLQPPAHEQLLQLRHATQAAAAALSAAEKDKQASQEALVLAERKLGACHAQPGGGSSGRRLAGVDLSGMGAGLGPAQEQLQQVLGVLASHAARVWDQVLRADVAGLWAELKAMASEARRLLWGVSATSQLSRGGGSFMSRVMSRVRSLGLLGPAIVAAPEPTPAGTAPPSALLGQRDAQEQCRPAADRHDEEGGEAGTASPGSAAGQCAQPGDGVQEGGSAVDTGGGAAGIAGLGRLEGVGQLLAAVGSLAATASATLGAALLGVAGSTTALAMEGGVAVVKFGMGVIAFALDFGLFCATLLFLLASRLDPIERAVRALPIGQDNQARASRVISSAMRGVFLTSLKLSIFHAAFTWITLTAFGTHFVYTLTAVSAVVAVLPLLPVWCVVLPPALELVLLKQTYLGAAALVGLHFGAQSYADEIILSDIETSAPYLTGLGVAGGMALWTNPLKGVLLGPMALALASAAYSLHAEFVRQQV